MDHSEEELERLASDLWEAEPVSLQEWQQLCDHTTDEVHVRNLSAQAKVGVDAWGRTKEQPLRISIVAKLTQTFDTAAQSDDVDESTINYGVLSKRVLEGLKQSTYEMENLNDLTHFVALFGGLYESDAVGAWTVEVCLPKALAVGSSIRFQNLVAKGDSSLTIANVLHLEDMTVSAIIGLNPHERYMKQPVVVNVWIGPSALGDDAERYVSVGQVIVKTVEESSFKTLEALAAKVASNVIKFFLLDYPYPVEVRVKLDKPLAVPLAEATGVEMTRSSGKEQDFGREAWEECGQRVPDHIPFPLEGRLDDYMRRIGIK